MSVFLCAMHAVTLDGGADGVCFILQLMHSTSCTALQN